MGYGRCVLIWVVLVLVGDGMIQSRWPPVIDDCQQVHDLELAV
jgi:hypothetical protein